MILQEIMFKYHTTVDRDV